MIWMGWKGASESALGSLVASRVRLKLIVVLQSLGDLVRRAGWPALWHECGKFRIVTVAHEIVSRRDFS
jgi:hypothetical protein